LVGTTKTDTVLLSVEMHGPFRKLAASSNLAPSQPSLAQIAARTGAAFSPIPADGIEPAEDGRVGTDELEDLINEIPSESGRCQEVLLRVFGQLYTQRVTLEGMILKPNMVLPGLTCADQKTVDEVADTTARCILRVVPATVPGIAFLSGGQSGQLASARLNAMNVRFKGHGRDCPGRWLFRSLARSSNRPWRSGGRGGPPIGGAASCVSSPGDPVCSCADQPAATRATNV
jgi:hypothetical protein